MKAKILWVPFFYITFLFPAVGSSSSDNYSSIQSGTPSEMNSVNSNKLLLPGIYNQVQTSVAVHPSNKDIMAVSAITDVYPGGYTTGAYITTNNGANWTGTNSIRDQLGNIITTVGDPTIVIDKNGAVIITYTAPPQSGSDLKVGISYSTNNGLYWSPTVYIPGVERADKVTSVADNEPMSPYYGRVYAIYSDYAKGGLYFSSSSNSGASWDSVRRLSPLFIDARVGSSITIGKTGELYVSWPFFDAATSSSYIGFAKSTNGGSNWISKDTAIFVNLSRLAFRVFLNSCRLNGLPVLSIDKSGGSRDGTIYITCTEKAGTGSPASDDYDVLIHSSTNHGTSWNAAHKVNQDNSGSLKYQFFPVSIVDDFGGVNVLYYDSRNTVSNDSFEVYLARSLDGGNSFQDFLVSDHKFKLKTINPTLFSVPGYIGSYIGIAASKRKIIPVWFDNSTGIYQTWTSSLDFGLDVKLIPQGFYSITENKLRMKDTIRAYLRNSNSPFAISDSSAGIIDSLTFYTGLVFRNAVSGNYYLEIRHRNCINTWSKYCLNYSSCKNPEYDFTVSSDQAMGDNMTEINNKYCIYSGDVNKDNRIDMLDIGDIYNAQANFLEGYTPSDVNGDSHIDLNDLSITFNNSLNFVSCITP